MTGSKLMRLALVLVAFSSFTVSPTEANRKVLRVTGRVVDGLGRPVSGAIVTLYYPPCRDCIDQILPVAYSLEDGVFFVELGHSTLKDVRLFVEERVPNGFWSPLGSPPFSQLSHQPQFQGIPIRAQGNYTVHLGDVRVRIRYGRVITDLPSVFPAYKATRKTATDLILRLKDHRGRIIYDGPLPNAAFDSTFFSVNLALSKGKWVVEFLLPDQNGRVRSRSLTVNVRAESCTKITGADDKETHMPC